jgi:hypothetical protein
MLNKIVFPLPVGLKLPYDTPENQGLFDGDSLVLPVFREDYNAPSPRMVETIQTVGDTAIAEIKRDFYKPDITCVDNRSHTIRFILQEIEKTGNMGSVSSDPCEIPLVMMWDYHRHDLYIDQVQGYTVRVGHFNEIKERSGSIRISHGTSNLNYGTGISIQFTQTHKIVGGSLVSYFT